LQNQATYWYNHHGLDLLSLVGGTSILQVGQAFSNFLNERYTTRRR
jgi:hypothetical protein